jgi:hypothetical protein
MIEAIVDDFLQNLELGDIPNCDINLSQYMESSLFKQAEYALFSERQSVSASASLYQEMRFNSIETYQGWEAMLIAPKTETKQITTSAVFSLVKVIRLSGNVFVDRHIVHDFPEAADIPGRHSISLLDTQKIAENDIFLIRPGSTTSTLRGDIEGSYFLRFNSPIRHPTTLSFDRNSLRFKTVAFSDSYATAKHFTTILIDKYLSECEAQFPGHCHDDRYRILDFLHQELSGSSHFFTKWKMVQTIARRQGPKIINFLYSTINGNLRNAARASEMVLNKINTKQ